MSGHCCIPVSDRFVVVRKQLDELGYKQSLALDGLPLVEQLLADLVHTTESLRRYKDLAQQALEKCNIVEQSSQPYVNENARLVRECNELHSKILSMKENSQENEKARQTKLKEYETEISDHKFLSRQLTERIIELQKQSAELSKKLSDKRKHEALITVPPGGRTRHFTFRRPTMEIDCLVSKGRPPSYSNSKNDDPPVDLVRLYEKRAAFLSEQLNKTKEQKEEEVQKCVTLQEKVALRDEEINRLKKMLEGGVPASTVINEQRLEALSELQQKVTSLETRLKDATTKQHEAMANAVRLAKKNEKLHREMSDMDKLACAINAEKCTLGKKLIQAQENLRECCNRCDQMQGDNVRIRDQMTSTNSVQEIKQLQRRLDAAQAELKSMKIRERELMLEIQRLTDSESAKTKHSTKTRDSARKRDPTTKKGSLSVRAKTKQQSMTGSEEETVPKQLDDPWVDQVPSNGHYSKPGQPEMPSDSERQRLRNHKTAVVSVDTDDLQLRLNECSKELAAVQQANANLTREVTMLQNQGKELEALQKANASLMKDLSSLQDQKKVLVELQQTNANLIRDMATLRDQGMELVALQQSNANLKKEVTTLREQLASKEYTSQVGRDVQSVNSQSEERMRQLESEQLELRSKLEGERRELSSAQGSHRAAVSSMEQQLRSSEAELTRQRTQYLQLKSLHEQTESSLVGLQAEMVHIRRDLAQAQAQLGELSGLQAQLKTVQEERARLKTQLGQAEQQRDELLLKVDEMCERVAGLQSELRAKESWATMAEQNITQLKKQLESKRCQKVITNVYTTLTFPAPASSPHASRKPPRPASHSATHIPTSSKPGPPPATARTSNKPGPATATAPTSAAGSSPLLHALRWVHWAKSPTSASEDASAARQQDSRGLQREVERLRNELEKASALRDASQREIKRLQDDLAGALQDCRVSQRDLALSQRETEDVKQKLQDYVAEVERVEQLLAHKEEERSELLEHFRSLSQEATELETHNHTLKSETSEVKRTLQATEGHVAHLEDQLASSKALIYGYESQITELTQHVTQLQAELQGVRDHARSLEKDLGAVRELCMKLDVQKEQLQEDLTNSKSKYTELEARSSQLHQELAGVQSQLSHEVGTKDALECVLERSREESLQHQLSNEELAREMQGLREQVARLQQQQAQSELSQRAECSRQVDALRRQVVSERFERARQGEETAAAQRYTVHTEVVASINNSAQHTSAHSTSGVEDAVSESPSLSLQSPESSD